MASEAQVAANRRNAEKSTGPRTPAGKAVVAQNAVKHGLSAWQNVIQGEDQAQFDLHRETLLGELAPVGPVESMLAERAVSLSWRLQRAERLQNEAFDALYADTISSPLAKLVQSLRPKGPDRPDGKGDPALGRVAVRDFSDARVLDRLLMYERRIEHSLFKTMAELQRLRLTRELDGPEQEPACSAWDKCPRSVKDAGRTRRAAAHHAQATCEETPPGITTNTVPTGASAPPVEMSHHSNIPSFQGSTDAPGQPVTDDASRKTNPISPGPNGGQLPCGKGVMNGPSQNGHGKTNPISMTKGHVACFESSRSSETSCESARQG